MKKNITVNYEKYYCRFICFAMWMCNNKFMLQKTENYYYIIACSKTILHIAPIDMAIRKNVFFHLYVGLACALEMPQESY